LIDDRSWATALGDKNFSFKRLHGDAEHAVVGQGCNHGLRERNEFGLWRCV